MIRLIRFRCFKST